MCCLVGYVLRQGLNVQSGWPQTHHLAQTGLQWQSSSFERDVFKNNLIFFFLSWLGYMTANLAPGSWRQGSQKFMGTLNYMANSVTPWATWHPISNKQKKICFSWRYSLKWAHATTTSQTKLLAREESFILSVLLRSVFSAVASWSYPHAAVSPGFLMQTLRHPFLPACSLSFKTKGSVLSPAHRVQTS